MCTKDIKKDAGDWLVSYQSMSSLPDEEGAEKHRALPLSGMAVSKARHSRILQEVGAKVDNVEERMEMAKRYSRAPSQRKSME